MNRVAEITFCLAAALLISSGNELTAQPSRTRASADDKKTEDKKTEDEITPILDGCTLHSAGRSVKPSGTKAPLVPDYEVGDLRLFVDSREVRTFRAGGDAPLWTAKVPADTALVWLAADEKAVYFAEYQIEKETGRDKPQSSAQVRRLDIASGKWLDHMALDAKAGERVEKVLTGHGRVLVLTVLNEEPGAKAAEQEGGYRVSCFDTGEVKARWSKSFNSAGKLASPGAFLLAAGRMPDKAQSAVQSLAWLELDILVCAGPVQDILCLKGDSGESRWRVPRVWEYKRGFIGPSVWQHFMVRAGEEEDKDGKNEKPTSRNAIVGGPVVVDGPKDKRDGGQSIFVAVAKGPAQYGEYLSDCVVYELDSNGKPVGMVTLPKMVRGASSRAMDGGVVWACQGGGFVRLVRSGNRDRRLSMGPGGPDFLCTVEWYRQLPQEKPAAWLNSDPAGDPVAFGERVAFRVRTGGYVPDPDAGIYHFPVTMVDLETGVARSLELRVPYKGKLSEPKTNFSRQTSFQTFGPYKMGVTKLDVQGKRLRITLGRENGADVLEFDTDGLQEPKSK